MARGQVYSYFSELGELTPKRFTLESVRSPEAFARWKKRLREELYAVLKIPGTIEPAELVEISQPWTKKGFRYQKVSMRTETKPCWDMSLYVVRPMEEAKKNISRALIALQAHGPGATSLIDLIDYSVYPNLTDAAVNAHNFNNCLQAVEAGFTLLVPELRGAGEFRDPEMIELGKKPNLPFPVPYSCQYHGGRLTHFGLTLLGMRIYDLLALLAYLESSCVSQEVFGTLDPRRIGILGHSGGGTVAMFAAAIAGSIAAAFVSGYFNDFASSILSMSHCACNYVQDLGLLGDMSEFASLIAPRPLLIASGVVDPIFPIEAARSGFKQVREVYSLLGKEGNLKFIEVPEKTGKRAHRPPDDDFPFQWFLENLR